MSDGDDIDDDNTVGGCVSATNNLDDTRKDSSRHSLNSNADTGSGSILDCSSGSDSNNGGNNDGNGGGGHGSNWWMLAYLLVTLGYLGLICSRALLSAGGSLKASAAVHRGMLRRVLKAPVAW